MEEVKFVVPVHAIAELRFVPKVTKYIASLEFHNHPKHEFWVTAKQGEALDRCFGENRYSTKANQVFAVLAKTDKGLRFIWPAVNEVKARESADHFAASWGWPDEAAQSESEAND